MAHLWPWFAVAAAGALHGLNPATGWMLAAWSARDGGRWQALRALLPVAGGHVAALVVVALSVPAALALGLQLDRWLLPGVATALLSLLGLRRFTRRRKAPASRAPGTASVALCSFGAAAAHGAGWMLVPALVPLCASDMPAREIVASGSLPLVLAAVAVHLAAMLGTTAAVAVSARRGFDAVRRLRARRAASSAASPCADQISRNSSATVERSQRFAGSCW